MHYVSCIRRYNALMNKVIWISGVTVSTRAKALVLTVTPLMHINLFISALYLRMHSTRALSYTYMTVVVYNEQSKRKMGAIREQWTIFPGGGTHIWKWQGCADKTPKVGVFQWQTK